MGSGLGTVFLTCVFTQLGFVVSGVVYSGIELLPQPRNLGRGGGGGEGNSSTDRVLLRPSPNFTH